MRRYEFILSIRNTGNFGGVIPITGIAVDFKGTFIRTTIPHAFRKVEQEKGGEKHE